MVAGTRGRGWTRTVAADNQVISMLGNHDIFLVYAQRDATNAALTTNGSAWAAALTSFLSAGKTIVLLDTTSVTNVGTFQIVQAAGLFNASMRTDVTGQTLTVVGPGDALSPRVPRTYRAETTSVSFVTAEVNQVVQAMSGAAVVIHKTF
jgi:hypothetical protein